MYRNVKTNKLFSIDSIIAFKGALSVPSDTKPLMHRASNSLTTMLSPLNYINEGVNLDEEIEIRIALAKDTSLASSS